jgi:hypothetical protein
MFGMVDHTFSMLAAVKALETNARCNNRQQICAASARLPKRFRIKVHAFNPPSCLIMMAGLLIPVHSTCKHCNDALTQLHDPMLFRRVTMTAFPAPLGTDAPRP